MPEYCLKFSDLLSHKESLYSQLDRVWNFFIVVSVAIAGWLLSDKNSFTQWQLGAIFVASAFFYYSNAWGVTSCLRRLEVALREMIEMLKCESCVLASSEFKRQLAVELDDVLKRRSTTLAHWIVFFAVIVIALRRQ
jgi:hypothetical protein